MADWVSNIARSLLTKKFINTNKKMESFEDWDMEVIRNEQHPANIASRCSSIKILLKQTPDLSFEFLCKSYRITNEQYQEFLQQLNKYTNE